MATIRGSKGRDRLAGTRLGDTIYAAAGDDTVYGLAGNDTLYGEAGNDSLYGHSGNDTLLGGVGIDKLFGGAGTDKLYGEIGNDYLDGGQGGDLLHGGAGYDTAAYSSSKAGVAVNLTSQTAAGGDATGDSLASIEHVIATNAADNLTGSALGNWLSGLGGNDTISGLAGNDTLDGGAGDDRLHGGDNDDWLFGGAGNDVMTGGAGDDVLRPGTGADTLDGGTGYNTVDYTDATGGIFLLLDSGTAGGAAFGDTLANIQMVIGSAFNDVVSASVFPVPAQTIDGRGGDDTLIANQVDGERLIGGSGNDQMIAAADSADQFQLQRNNGEDYITGFDATNVVVADRDTLVIDGDEFGIGSALDPSELVAVLDGAGPQFLQQASGGDLLLYHDADGVAASHGLVLVARLSGVTSVSVADFLVI